MNGAKKLPIGDPMPRIARVSVDGPCSVLVKWGAGLRKGSTSSVDLAPMIYTFKVFAPLRTDAELFGTVHVVENGGAIAWGADDSVDMAATTVEDLAEEAMSTADFAAFLKRNKLSFDAAAAQLGISRRLVAYYAKERAIPRHIALACAYLEEKLREGAPRTLVRPAFHLGSVAIRGRRSSVG